MGELKPLQGLPHVQCSRDHAVSMLGHRDCNIHHCLTPWPGPVSVLLQNSPGCLCSGIGSTPMMTRGFGATK